MRKCAPTESPNNTRSAKMREVKVFIFRKVRNGVFEHERNATGKIISTGRNGHDHITRQDIDDLLDYANDCCQLNEVPFDAIKIPMKFALATDRLLERHQARALTLMIDRDTGMMGWSFCHERDQFSREAGVLISANRLADQLQAGGKRVWFTNIDSGESSLLVDAGELSDPSISQVLREKYGIGSKRRTA